MRRENPYRCCGEKKKPYQALGNGRWGPGARGLLGEGVLPGGRGGDRAHSPPRHRKPARSQQGKVPHGKRTTQPNTRLGERP